MRLIPAWLALSAALALPACFDTQEEFDKFLDRSEPFRSEPAAGECFGPVDLSGTYLLGIGVVANPALPLRYKATFDIDTTSAPWTFSATIQATKLADGTLVGDVYQATSPIEQDGSFSLDFGAVTVPPEANSLLPAEAVATFKMDGCTSTATFACGAVLGDITKPVTLPLAGSTWAITPWADGVDPMTLTAVSACPE